MIRSRVFWLILLALLLIPAVAYIAYLDVSVRNQFEGKRWELPARVYARPLELYVGKNLGIAQFLEELEGLRYKFVKDPRYPGEVARNGNVFLFITRKSLFWDGVQEPQEIRVVLDPDQVISIHDLTTGGSPPLVRMDPELIGIIYPSHNEDRLLVQLQDVPSHLVEMLLAVEDKGFYGHFGASPRSILRAMLANLKAGRVVQGGSTLTQQLVKNFFLSNERSLSRKLNEAIMAVLLEVHYTKQEILEAYLNEVFLGQDGRRAIHGFGLASQFYFEQALTELSNDRIALLVALVKGASHYDPRRYPDRALARRNLTLEVAMDNGVLSEKEATYAMGHPLGVVARRRASMNRYPAFLGLVRQQLHRDYHENDLTSQGLNIFTTLDPWVQDSLESTISNQLPELEQRRNLAPGLLQIAAVVTSTEGGELLALVGGNDPHYAGFNRALDSMRPIGSIVKPAVYLAALQQSQSFTLATALPDTPLTVSNKYSGDWTPQNFDQTFHGDVLLYRALASSFNVATAHLGMSVGLDAIIDTLQRLGLDRRPPAYPSLVLGALELSPFEVAGLYQTLASGGFQSPIRAIRAVAGVDGEQLQRYPISVQQVFEQEHVYLINSALQKVVSEGTARGLANYLPRELGLAGKTGTTDDLRDSWFAGFSGDRLAVVWIGRDDNKSTGLTGSSGAMQIWGAFMAKAGVRPLQLSPTASIEYEWIDSNSGLRSDAHCANTIQLPFIAGTVPVESAKCSGFGKALRWFNPKP